MKTKHFFASFFIVGLLLGPSVMFAETSSIDDLSRQIQALQLTVQNLQRQLNEQRGGNTVVQSPAPISTNTPVSSSTNGNFCYTFTKNLRIGDSSEDVRALHTALSLERPRILTQAVSLNEFDEITASTVVAFQEKYASEILVPNGLKHGNGYVGASTRAKLNVLYGCKKTVTTGPDLALTNVQFSPDTIYVGDWITTTVTVRNLSNVDRKNPFTVNVQGTVKVVDSLDAGAEVKVTVPNVFSFGTPGTHSLNFSIDVSGDTKTDNNWLPATVSIIPNPNKPFVWVTSPNGGEKLVAGQTYPITVKTGNLPSGTNILLQLSYVKAGNCKGGCEEYTDAIATIGSGESYSWTVPSRYVSSDIASDNFQILAKLVGSSVSVEDLSDSFFSIGSGVSQPSITVLSPNGGEVWTKGSTKTITWLSIDRGDIFDIDVSPYPANEPTYHIATGINSKSQNGTYQWSVGKVTEGINPTPIDLPSGNYRLFVGQSGAGTKDSDVTDSYFTITAPTVTQQSAGTSVSASLRYAQENKAGLWSWFRPGPGNINENVNDWNWEMTLNLPGKKTISRITLIHNAPGEVWSTGYSRYLKDGTDLYKGREEHPYPLVVFRDGTQINTAYDQTIEAEFGDTFKLYGQPEEEVFAGGKIVVEFSDGTKVEGNVPASSIRQASAPIGVTAQQVPNTNPPSLKVSIDTTTPLSKTVSAGATNVEFANVRVVAGDQAVNNMNNIQVGAPGLTNADKILKNIKVFDGATQIGQTAANLSYNGSYYYVWIPVSGITIPALTAKTFRIVADINPNVSGQIRAGITGWNFNGGATVDPFGQPIYGNMFTITAPSATPTATPTPSITVLSPNGGESYVSGRGSIEIKYLSQGLEGKTLTAYLWSPTYGNVRSLSNLPADRSNSVSYIAFDLEKAGPDSVGQYKINLCSPDVKGNGVCDYSDNFFTLTAQPISLQISPASSANPSQLFITINNGQTSATKPVIHSLAVSCYASDRSITAGQGVAWQVSQSGGDYLSYSYSWTGTDNLSGSGTPVVKTYNTSGLKLATVTVKSGEQTATASCTVEVKPTEGALTPQSSINTIATPTVRITSPDGGEKWIIGREAVVKWELLNFANVLAYVDVYLIPQDGRVPIALAKNYSPSSQSLTLQVLDRVTLPNGTVKQTTMQPNKTYKIRVSCQPTNPAGFTSCGAESDKVFTILDK